MLSWQERFRAIFTGLVLADIWADTGLDATAVGNPSEGPAEAQASCPWQQAFVQIAQFYGQAAEPASESRGWAGAIAPAHPLAVGLAAVPWMLLHLDRPGQGETALNHWLAHQGVQSEAQDLAEVIFKVLRKGMRSARPMTSSRSFKEPFDWLDPARVEGGLLSQAAEMVAQTQGQYSLALPWAVQHRAEQDYLLPLVGLFSALHTGVSGIPLSWRLQYLYSQEGALQDPQPRLRQRWAIADEATLWQLADTLFYRWIGVAGNSPRPKEALHYPVVPVGTALDWATQEASL